MKKASLALILLILLLALFGNNSAQASYWFLYWPGEDVIASDRDMICLVRNNGLVYETCIDDSFLTEVTATLRYVEFDANNNVLDKNTIFTQSYSPSEKKDWMCFFLPKKSNKTYYKFEYSGNQEKNLPVTAIVVDDNYNYHCHAENHLGKKHPVLDAFDIIYYNVNHSTLDSTMYVGQKMKLWTTVDLHKAITKHDFSAPSYTWNSSDSSVLYVDEEGFLIGRQPGKSVISLSIAGTQIYSETVTVKKLEIPKSIEVFCGEKLYYTTKIIDSSLLQFNIEDPSIATLENSTITGLREGSTRLTIQYGAEVCNYEIIVRNNELSDKTIELYSGMQDTITVNGVNPVQWESSNNKIVEVNNGSIIALRPGTATITVKAGNQTLECQVIVKESTLLSNNITVELGEDIHIDVLGSDAIPKYISSNEDIVKQIDGKLITVKPGKVSISVKLRDETLKCKVKVVKKAAPTGFDYEASSKVIKLKWDEYSGAKTFSVYLYNEEAKKYQLIDTVKKAAYTAKDLVPGKTYIFKVAANVKINGSLMEQSLSEKIKCKTAKKDIVGWQTVDGKKYYYKDGFAVGEGIRKIDGNKYIFDAEGVLVTNKFSTIEGAKYYSDCSGKVAVSKEVTDKENDITYVADKDGVLTKKKSSSSTKTTKTSTKTVTFNDITMDFPTSWGSVTKDGDSYIYSFNSSMFMIYTDPQSGSLTQSKADSLVKEFKDYSCISLDINKSKKYTYDKKISTYYLYTLDLKIPNETGYGSASCKGRLIAFEYNGKYYVAVMVVEKSQYNEDSFDEYTEVIKSIKPIKKATGGSTKNTRSTDTVVWITETGGCYHRINKCGNGTYYETTLSIAKQLGLSPCGKCCK